MNRHRITYRAADVRDAAMFAAVARRHWPGVERTATGWFGHRRLTAWGEPHALHLLGVELVRRFGGTVTEPTPG